MMSETKQPTMSRRAREAQPFRAMVFGERADEMIARSISVIKLSLGEPDFGAPPAVRDAMREQYDGRALPYTAALGLPELRRAIAASTMNAIMSTSTPDASSSPQAGLPHCCWPPRSPSTPAMR